MARIIFIGAVDFSLHCLQELIKNEANLVGVVTLSKNLSKRHADYADLEPLASSNHLPIIWVSDVNAPDSIKAIKALKPDVIFVFGWSQIVGPEVLAIPKMGCVGTHPALLPQHRGRHPLIWALVEGRTEGGLTFFFLDEGADSGDILWQKSFPITFDDDAAALYGKMKQLATKAIAEFMPSFEKGNPARVPQDNKLASYCRKRTEKDGEIDWNAPALTIYNLVRALTHPYVGAHADLDGQKILVWKVSRPKPSSQKKPGTIFNRSSKEFDVQTGDGVLTVLDYSETGASHESVGHLSSSR